MKREIGLRAPGASLDVERVFRIVVFAGIPAALLLTVLRSSVAGGDFAVDFHRAFWPAGRMVLDGDFRYDLLLQRTDPFVYPPLTAVLFAPIAALPVGLAELLFTLAGIASVVVALRWCGVRDWRCYGVAFLWPPVLAAVQAGNLTLLLVGGVALAWRLRSRRAALGLTVAILVSAKLFLWPLLVWLAVTRRYAAAGWAVVVAVGLNAVCWVAVGAGSFTAYVHLLHDLTASEGRDTYTLPSIFLRLGLPSQAGVAAAVVIGVAALASARRGWTADDRVGLAAVVVVALLLSPIVWLHYMALLLVPVALTRRSLGWVWLVPLATFVCPGYGSGSLGQAAVGIALVGAVVTVVGLPFGSPRSLPIPDADAAPLFELDRRAVAPGEHRPASDRRFDLVPEGLFAVGADERDLEL